VIGAGSGPSGGGRWTPPICSRPALASGQPLRCIGSTTLQGNTAQYFEKDRAFGGARVPERFDVNEPSIPDAIEILKGLKPYFEGLPQASNTPATPSRRRSSSQARLHP